MQQSINMSETIKLDDLNVTQINQLLKHHLIKISGTKDSKIAALIDYLGSDRVPRSELQQILNGQTEVQELRQMVAQLKATITEMTAQRSREAESNTTAENTRPNIVNASEHAHDDEIVQSENENIVQELANATSQPRNSYRSEYSVREIGEAMPEFDPMHRNISSLQFMQKIKQLQQVYAWPDKLTVLALTQKLKGVARDWMDAQPVYTSLYEFESSFLRDFPSTVNVADCHKEMMRKKRPTNGCYIKYYYEMLAIGRRGGIDEDSIVTYMIDGLNDTQLSKTLLTMDVHSCNDVLRSLERHARKPNEQQTATAKIEKLEVERKAPRCYNCNEIGHMAAKCPKPNKRVKCSNCGIGGHEAKSCRKLAQGTNKVAVIQANDKAPPMLQIVIVNEQQMVGFVDTGSGRSLIGARASGNMEKEPAHAILQGFGGAVVIVTELVRAKMKINQQTLNVSLLVVQDEILPNDGSQVDLLLGRDVLTQVAGISVMQLNDRREFTFDIEESLEEADRKAIKSLIDRKLECFAEQITEIGKCTTGEFDITTTTDSAIVGKRYLVPFSQREELSNILKNLRENNIIRASESPHAASVLLVEKSNGERRMCVDFRALNAVTVKQHYVMPVVEEQISKLSGNKYFTVLDMTSGYYQIPVKESARHFTAFLTPEGLFEFNVMPFGLVNAPMTFQKIMTDIIKRMKYRHKVVNYVDEVIIGTETVAENLIVLEELLDVLRDAGLTARPTKCHFLKRTVNFLGHKINASGIHPGEEKTRCIEEFPIPTNATEVRRFLGITGFFRKFIKNYSLIAKQLTELLKKGTKFEWTSAHQYSFENLKKALISNPVLTIYDANKNHEVHTDASTIGLSGILMQETDEGLKPVFYFSRQCTDAESRYFSYELEVLAVVETLERYRMYLWGKPFVVVTDCNAIATTKQTTPLLPRIARWWLKLQEFDFVCIHRAGTKMSHADAMSRSPVLPPTTTTSETVADNVLTMTETQDWVVALQLQDVKLQNIMKLLREDNTTEANQLKKEYEIQGGRLYRRTSEGFRLVVPHRERWRVVKACHDDCGHFGIEKSIQRVSKNFWFPRLRKYVTEYVEACPECCINKVKGGKPQGEMHIREVLPIPLRSVHLDHLRPFPKSKQGNCYILVIICSFSKHSVIKAVRTTKTTPVINAMREYFATYGQPIRIVTDRGTAYTSKEFEKFIADHGIQHVKVGVRTPRANGQAERLNRTLLASLRCMTRNSKDWDKQLAPLQWGINSQINSTTKMSPNDLIFNYNPRDFTTNRFIQAVDDELVEVSKPSDEMKNWALSNIQKAEAGWKRRYDAKHRKPHEYQKGDLVALEYIPTATGASHKLDPKYKGPYEITRVLDFDRYVVEDLPDLPMSQKHYVGILPSDRLKPWCCLGPIDEGADDESQQSSDGSGEAEL